MADIEPAALKIADLIRRLRSIADKYRRGTEEDLVLRVAADVIGGSIEDYNDLLRRPVTQAMVDRFIAWPLPKDFAPDCGIAFTPLAHSWPTGTNLLTADQARSMLEHVLGPCNRERSSDHG